MFDARWLDQLILLGKFQVFSFFSDFVAEFYKNILFH